MNRFDAFFGNMPAHVNILIFLIMVLFILVMISISMDTSTEDEDKKLERLTEPKEEKSASDGINVTQNNTTINYITINNIINVEVKEDSDHEH